MTTESDEALNDERAPNIADLPKAMAMVRFQMEAEAGHPVSQDVVTFKMVRGVPVIVTTYSEIRDE